MPGWRQRGLSNRGGEVAALSLLGTEEGLALGSRTWGGLRPAQAGGLLEPSSSIFIPKKEGQKKKKRGGDQRGSPPPRGARALRTPALQEQRGPDMPEPHRAWAGARIFSQARSGATAPSPGPLNSLGTCSAWARPRRRGPTSDPQEKRVTGSWRGQGCLISVKVLK